MSTINPKYKARCRHCPFNLTGEFVEPVAQGMREHVATYHPNGTLTIEEARQLVEPILDNPGATNS